MFGVQGSGMRVGAKVYLLFWLQIPKSIGIKDTPRKGGLWARQDIPKSETTLQSFRVNPTSQRRSPQS